MAASVIGALRVNLGLDSAKFEKGAGRAQKRMGGMKTGFAALARSAGVLGAALTAAFSLGSVTRQIADFDASTAKLGAISRATAGEMQQMRKVAQELGASTEFSATQAADALTFLSMAGFSARESLASIPAVLDLATASGMGLAEAADTASNIMSGFGIAAEKAGSVADVLAAASTRANTNVSQLGSAMSTVAPVAAALNIGLEDTAAAIGILSDAGIQGERAGTNLRSVLASLSAPTKAATDALSNYGLTAKDVDVSSRPLADVLRTLQEAGLSTADAFAIFGREAASGALVLSGSAARFAEFGQELRNVEGAAGDMAAQIRDNLRGDLQGAASAAQGLALALGDAGLTAVIRGVVQAFTWLLRALSAGVSMIAEFVRGVLGIPPSVDAAREAQDALNTALGEFSRTRAPTAAANAIALANANYELAKSALDAAEAEVAKRRALADRTGDGRMGRGRQTELDAAEADLQAAEDALAQARKRIEHTVRTVAGAASVEMGAVADITNEVKVTFEGLEESAGSAGGRIGEAFKDVAKPAIKEADDAASRFGSTMASEFSSAFQGVESLSEGVGRLASRLRDMAMDSAIQGLFGALGGTERGGSIFGALGGIFGGLPSFEGGGFTGMGPRTGGIDGRGGILSVLHPNETVTDHTRGGGGGASTLHVSFEPGLRGELRGEMQGIAVTVNRQQTPRQIGAALSRARETRALG